MSFVSSFSTPDTSETTQCIYVEKSREYGNNPAANCNNGDRDIPTDLTITSVCLWIRRNNITRIRAQTLSNYSSLQILDVSDYEVKNIDSFAFKFQRDLRVLWLSGNKLDSGNSTVVPTDAFYGLSKLQILGICCIPSNEHGVQR